MPEEQNLVDSFLKSRSEAIFRQLYRNQTPALYQMALRLSGQQVVDAEELIQNMWMVAIEKLPGFEWRSTFKTWLTGILINTSRQKYREKLRETSLEQLDDLIINESTNHQINPLDLENAITALPSGYRQVMILHDIEGYTHQEIATMLEVSPGTSKSQLFQARKAVRVYLNDLKNESYHD